MLTEDSTNTPDFKRVFESMPGNVLLLQAQAGYQIVAVSGDYAEHAHLPASAIVQQPYFEHLVTLGHSGNGLQQKIQEAIEHVIAHNVHQTIVVAQAFFVGNSYPTSHQCTIHLRPVTASSGAITGIIHSVEELALQHISQQAEPATPTSLLQQVLEKAPVAFHILRGENLVIEVANQPSLDLWGKGPSVIGKPVIEALPELTNQGYIELLQKVRTTGQPHATYEASVTLVRDDQATTAYVNFILQPFYDAGAKEPGGVLVVCTDVTNEVTTRKELIGKEQTLLLALEIGQLGIFSVDVLTNTATFSHHIANWFGVVEGQLSLEYIFSRIHPEDRPSVIEAIEASTRGNNSGRHDLVYRVGSPSDSSQHYFRSIGQVQFNDGQPLTISGIIQDVTTQVMLTKDVEESEKRFRTMAEASDVLIAVTDKFSKITYINNAWIELTGKPYDSLINESWATMIHPEDHPNLVLAYRQAVEQSMSFETEFRILDKHGEFRWLLAKVPARFTPDGEFLGFISSCIDITERKKAENDLHKNDAQLRAIIAAAPMAIALFVGRNLVVEMPNQAFIDIVGKGADIVGKPLSEVMPELVGQPYLQILDDVFTSGKRYQTIGTPVNIVQHGQMKYGFYDFSYTPLFNDEGEVYAILDIAMDVTSQVNAQKSLAASEANLRNTILDAPVAMCLLKGSHYVVEIANHRMLELWGKTADNILHRSLFEGLPEARNQGFEELLKHVYTTGKAYTAHELPVHLPRNGVDTLKYVNFVYEAVKDADGTINGIMVVALEVTEQVEARKRIEASEQQVRSLVESAPFPIGVYIGREMRISLVNQSIIDTWGKGSNLVGKLYADVLPELSNQEVYEQLDSVYMSGLPFHAKNQRIDLTIEGELKPFYFNYNFTPLFDAEGQVYGVMNTAADVTDLNIAKQMVEASERDFRNLVMHAPVGICIVGGKPLALELINDSFLEVVGQNREIAEKNGYAGLVPHGADIFLPIIEQVFTSGIAYRARERKLKVVRQGEEEMIYANFVCDPLKNSHGQVAKVMVFVIEVTAQVVARQKIEEVVAQRTWELAEANKSLQQNNEELGQFAYIASHDLQEPLRKVSTFTDLLKQRLGQLDEPAERYLERITASTRRMSQLIHDVLNYSQLTNAREVYEPVNLNVVLENIIDDFELLIEQKGARVHIEKLPTLQAVPLQMQQLFSNLVSNALKFSRQGETPVITVTATRELPGTGASEGLLADTPYYVIKIEDNGIGFNQEYAERIFNIFQRLHTKSDYAGTGIGLALCKKIVQNHHGEIVAVSGETHGATFYIRLPEQQPGNGNGTRD